MKQENIQARKEKILVTGCTGMIGRAVTQALLKCSYSVRAQARSQKSLDRLFVRQSKTNPGLAAVAADSCGGDFKTDLLEQDASPETSFETAIFDLNELTESDAEKLCQGCTAIVHTAALVHRSESTLSEYERTNLRASKTLADAAKKCGLEQFVFLSSSSVYGNRETVMVDESQELHADTPYSLSKIQTEEYLRSNPPTASTVILRPALVFGEGDRGNMLSLIRQVLSGRYFLVADGSAGKSLIYAGDLAKAIVLLLKRKRQGLFIYNIANPEPVSVKELSSSILKAANKSEHLLSLPLAFVKSAAKIANLVLKNRSPLSQDRLDKLCRTNSVSVAAFETEFGELHPEKLQDALAREIDWAKMEGLLVDSD